MNGVYSREDQLGPAYQIWHPDGDEYECAYWHDGTLKRVEHWIKDPYKGTLLESVEYWQDGMRIGTDHM